ncbi:RelA/SpoT family protein [Geminicoccus flavidas]|uniref:RelA/SpoT family protein n=1 Tax=Geminicoccus flavidas TaxID=2506407 RepID=UPI001358EF6F|nr:bifunctional (p)ppGpp synthetase/guanosine-3',5'-bis(diphosphate) 3'-pyrophosphohydrolase [Geminicoccus flavidas]
MEGGEVLVRPAAEAQAEPAKPVPRRKVLRQYELVDLVRAYDPDVDEELLDRAYVFTMRAHGSQLRASGDPYYHHPVEVAGILAGLKLDTASIATGLLHDTVEDTVTTNAELARLFGKEVARLVEGVTKLNKIELQSAETAQAENFRKLLLAMSEDIRVLLVKLADRLHNMRTLHFIKNEERRKRIARETLEIYAPLAERIGMEAMKGELEDLAFAELWPDYREGVLHRLNTLRQGDDGLIERVCTALRETLHKEGIEAEITGRVKTPYSIWRKMQNKNVSFEQLSDLMAFRVIVGTVGECYAALGVIHGKWQTLPGRFKDYISLPKPNGYRSLHTTILGPEGRKVEIQIRTAEMHEVAELGVAAHWAYKEGERPRDGRQFRWLRSLLDILEHASDPEEFLEHTKLEMFQDQVFCFTPKGQLINLPRGATPVDFAYAVHSQIGDTCVGAKVDGRIVQLRTQLKNGDQVQIITAKGATPSPAWERFVVTGRARSRVRRFLRQQRRSEFIDQGKDQVTKLAEREHLPFGEKHLDKARTALGLKSVEDLLVAVGDGTLSARSVIDAVRTELQPAEPQEETLVPNRAKGLAVEQTEHAGPIRGLPPGVAFHFAGCCHPVPGDAIIGLVRTGKGIAIHRVECRTVAAEDVSGALTLGWNGQLNGATAPARLTVMATNKPGALGTISTLIGKQGGNITDVRMNRKDDQLFEITLDVEVQSREQLDQIQAALRSSSIVNGVERLLVG